jgi:hypothetical protein
MKIEPHREYLAEIRASLEDLDGAELELAAPAGDGLAVTAAEGDDAPRFRMLAYAGAAMRFPNLSPHPIVVDFQGVEAAGESIPILRDHDPKQRIGHGSISVTAKGIEAAGVMSGAGSAADETRAEARRGFPFQASIGARITRAEFVRKGSTATVNGRTVAGPVVIARRAVVYEVSWVSLGRDSGTAARLAAQRKGRTMEFEAWLAEMGIQASALTDAQEKRLRQAHRIECGELEVVEAGAGSGSGGGSGSGSGGGFQGGAVESSRRELETIHNETIREIRATRSAEMERIAGIEDLCGEEYATIAATAIREGWDTTRTEVEIYRKGRPTIGIQARRGSAGTPINSATLEAAALVALGYDDDTTIQAFNDDGHNGEQLLDDARTRFRGMGLMGLALEAARADGVNLGSSYDTEATIQAAVSTSSLSSVASNVVSKIAMRIYEAHPIVAMQVCKIRNVPDFKQVEGYRMDGTGQWQKAGKGGSLEAGKLDDTGYNNKADLYGQVIGIDYKDFVNDDLGILEDTGRLLGIQGRSLVDHLFAERVLGNADMDGNTFFSSGNSNLISGATSAFGLTGLSKAREAFRKTKAGPGAKAADKRPIMIEPRILMVPPELETDAETILNATGVNLAGDTDRERPSMNPWRNKYQLTVLPHLSDSSYTNNSAAAWYLFADPGLVPALELVFVQGRRAPTIQKVAAPHDSLGLFYRGHFGVGCNFIDPKGAQKAAGS